MKVSTPVLFRLGILSLSGALAVMFVVPAIRHKPWDIVGFHFRAEDAGSIPAIAGWCCRTMGNPCDWSSDLGGTQGGEACATGMDAVVKDSNKTSAQYLCNYTICQVKAYCCVPQEGPVKAEADGTCHQPRTQQACSEAGNGAIFYPSARTAVARKNANPDDGDKSKCEDNESNGCQGWGLVCAKGRIDTSKDIQDDKADPPVDQRKYLCRVEGGTAVSRADYDAAGGDGKKGNYWLPLIDDDEVDPKTGELTDKGKLRETDCKDGSTPKGCNPTPTYCVYDKDGKPTCVAYVTGKEPKETVDQVNAQTKEDEAELAALSDQITAGAADPGIPTKDPGIPAAGAKKEKAATPSIARFKALKRAAIQRFHDSIRNVRVSDKDKAGFINGPLYSQAKDYLEDGDDTKLKGAFWDADSCRVLCNKGAPVKGPAVPDPKPKVPQQPQQPPPQQQQPKGGGGGGGGAPRMPPPVPPVASSSSSSSSSSAATTTTTGGSNGTASNQTICSASLGSCVPLKKQLDGSWGPDYEAMDAAANGDSSSSTSVSSVASSAASVSGGTSSETLSAVASTGGAASTGGTALQGDVAGTGTSTAASTGSAGGAGASSADPVTPYMSSEISVSDPQSSDASAASGGSSSYPLGTMGTCAKRLPNGQPHYCGHPGTDTNPLVEYGSCSSVNYVSTTGCSSGGSSAGGSKSSSKSSSSSSSNSSNGGTTSGGTNSGGNSSGTFSTASVPKSSSSSKSSSAKSSSSLPICQIVAPIIVGASSSSTSSVPTCYTQGQGYNPSILHPNGTLPCCLGLLFFNADPACAAGACSYVCEPAGWTPAQPLTLVPGSRYLADLTATVSSVVYACPDGFTLVTNADGSVVCSNCVSSSSSSKMSSSSSTRTCYANIGPCSGDNTCAKNAPDTHGVVACNFLDVVDACVNYAYQTTSVCSTSSSSKSSSSSVKECCTYTQQIYNAQDNQWMCPSGYSGFDPNASSSSSLIGFSFSRWWASIIGDPGISSASSSSTSIVLNGGLCRDCSKCYSSSSSSKSSSSSVNDCCSYTALTVNGTTGDTFCANSSAARITINGMEKCADCRRCSSSSSSRSSTSGNSSGGNGSSKNSSITDCCTYANVTTNGQTGDTFCSNSSATPTTVNGVVKCVDCSRCYPGSRSSSNSNASNRSSSSSLNDCCVYSNLTVNGQTGDTFCSNSSATPTTVNGAIKCVDCSRCYASSRSSTSSNRSNVSSATECCSTTACVHNAETNVQFCKNANATLLHGADGGCTCRDCSSCYNSSNASNKSSSSIHCTGTECSNGGNAVCGNKGQTCKQDFTNSTCTICIGGTSSNSSATACKGNECSIGGSLVCSAKNLPCSATGTNPCYQCGSGNSSSRSSIYCTGTECSNGGNAVCGNKGQTCKQDFTNSTCTICIGGASSNSSATACKGNECTIGGSLVCSTKSLPCSTTGTNPCYQCGSGNSSSRSTSSVLACLGNECATGGDELCKAKGMTCSKIDTLPCVVCVSPQTQQCKGNECANGGSNLCASKSLTCNTTSSQPCLTCTGGTMECDGHACAAGGAAVCGMQNLPCSETSNNPCFQCGAQTMVCDDKACADGGDAVCGPKHLMCTATQNNPCFACSTVFCGNGVLETQYGENCDDGANNGTQGDYCSAQCQIIATCGNGIVEQGELCDNGLKNGTPGDVCTASCGYTSSCGNGRLDPGEQCDDGNGRSGDGCNSSCRLESGVVVRCGDSIIETGEQCDDGLKNGTAGDFCDAFCQYVASCSNGRLDPGEQCDDGNTRDGDGCTHDCRLDPLTYPHCGNHRIDVGEECDDGLKNGTPGDGCLQGCRLAPGVVPRCGDGTLEIGEECDEDGRNSDTTPDQCRTSCRIASCGDGVVDQGEQCDDGLRNGTSGDLCDQYCRSGSGQFGQGGQFGQNGQFGQGQANLLTPYSNGAGGQGMLAGLIGNHPPAGKTGPAALAIMAAGAASGVAWVRRKKGKKS